MLALLSKCQKAHNSMERKHCKTKIQRKKHSRRDIRLSSSVFFPAVFDNNVNDDRRKGFRVNYFVPIVGNDANFKLTPCSNLFYRCNVSKKLEEFFFSIFAICVYAIGF